MDAVAMPVRKVVNEKDRKHNVEAEKGLSGDGGIQ